jgi:4-hydroxybenzoate polyprenyltransferase
MIPAQDSPPTTGSVVRGLVLGCHPGPTLVVTTAVTAVAASLGRGWAGSAVVLVAVLSGQLSVGWANDARDARRDTLAGRQDKPVVRGWITARTLWIAAFTAAIACVPLSFLAAGPRGGAAHLVAVALAWAYDLWLKTTPWSFLPYTVAFAMVVPFLSYGLDPPRPPAPWAMAALGLLGLGAHLANGIPDIEGDRQVDAQGLVARIGARAAGIVATVALVIATGLLVGHLGLSPILAAAISAALALATAATAATASGRYLFGLVLVLGITDAALVCLASHVIISG